MSTLRHTLTLCPIIQPTMTTRKLFEQVIIKKSDSPNKNGYVLNNSDNLINGLNVDLFRDDLMQGSGNELISKFNALYSSSALAVNNFAIVKKYRKDFSFLDYSNFDNADFERQFKTGLSGTPPNLDFALENKDTVIAFESKYLELLDKKKVVFKDSYNKSNLSYLNDFWFNLIDSYVDNELFLDVAQLIKHSIGLINYKRNLPDKQTKKVLLIYIFWTPINSDKFSEYIQHSNELNKFTDNIKKQSDIEFVSMTYNQFWDLYQNIPIFKVHFDKLRTRYSIEI